MGSVVFRTTTYFQYIGEVSEDPAVPTQCPINTLSMYDGQVNETPMGVLGKIHKVEAYLYRMFETSEIEGTDSIVTNIDINLSTEDYPEVLEDEVLYIRRPANPLSAMFAVVAGPNFPPSTSSPSGTTVKMNIIVIRNT